MTTHNQIKKLFSDIVENHKMLKSFGIGDIWEVGATEELQLPCMWVVVNPVSVEATQMIMNYSLLFFDSVDKDEGNEDEVLSDMQRVALDVLALLDNNFYKDNFLLNKPTNMEDFTERFDDEVTGWKVDIALRQKFSGNFCQIPLIEIPEI